MSKTIYQYNSYNRLDVCDFLFAPSINMDFQLLGYAMLGLGLKSKFFNLSLYTIV